MLNQLQAVALNEGLLCKKRLWREHGREQLESFQLAPWASRRRNDLLELLDRLHGLVRSKKRLKPPTLLERRCYNGNGNGYCEDLSDRLLRKTLITSRQSSFAREFALYAGRVRPG
jgi:hypothetical protein